MKDNKLIFREAPEGIYQYMTFECHNEITSKKSEVKAVGMEITDEELDFIQKGKWEEVSEWIKKVVNGLIK